MNQIAFYEEEYELPLSKNHNYLKLQPGENKFRILSRPVVGWETWVEKKPVRYRFNEKPAKTEDLKHFWSMIVWSYANESIQILHITQASVLKALDILIKDPDWGAPFFYDIKIVKEGEAKETRYRVNPLPNKPLNPAIEKAFEAKRCDLDALFVGEDPFSPLGTHTTKGVFSEADASSKAEVVPLMSPFDSLKAMLEKENISTKHLEGFLHSQAARKGVAVSALIESVLNSDIFPRFRDKFVADLPKLEEMASKS